MSGPRLAPLLRQLLWLLPGVVVYRCCAFLLLTASFCHVRPWPYLHCWLPRRRRRHACFACGQTGSVSKCSMGQCSRHYHWGCVTGNSLARVAPSGKCFKCPLHYCARCGLSGDGIPMVQCAYCPSGYHIRCVWAGVRV